MWKELWWINAGWIQKLVYNCFSAKKLLGEGGKMNSKYGKNGQSIGVLLCSVTAHARIQVSKVAVVNLSYSYPH